ncbi:MAG: TfoX/Sxy family protein [Ruminococcus sp.]|nr:TfoX/Sxy family protein [Ruminococcus sp.]
MASKKDYLEFVLEQLSGLSDISYRAMMGEYIIYYKGRITGGIYDDRFLVKITPSSEMLLNGAPLETPYEGAKQMLLVEDIENRELLENLFTAMYDELPEPAKRKKRS